MAKINKVYFLFCIVLLLLSAKIVYSAGQVVVEFLYKDPSKNPLWSPHCHACMQEYEEFLMKNETMNRIQSNYTNQVFVNWTEFESSEGRAKAQIYKVGANSIIIKDKEGNFTVVQAAFNETYIRKVIDAYLAEALPPPDSTPTLIAILALAFSFGFFETFSPCLIALLSFVLSYTIGETTTFKEGFIKVIVFGIGFVSASIILGVAVGIIFLSIIAIQTVLMIIICLFAIFFGLDLLGLNILKFLKINFETKPFVKRITKKYMFTYTGLLIVGFLFYFLDPCIAPIFVSLVPLLLSKFLPLIMFIFCLGVLIPFIGIGIFAGSVSRLARTTYRHRFIIRGVSGLILICYALYLIVFYVIL